ncbi:nitrite reductase [Cytobacillus suaedae]|nr:nitrite reductase [Cytobacillus suaedae]
MENKDKYVKLAINGGISFGAKLTAKQLITIARYLKDEEEIELTTFQQLYIDVPERKLEEIKEELANNGLKCYPVGPYVKSLRTCNFCKGAEEEGMSVAVELNERIAGKPVPRTLRPAYTGCPNACGEPLINDIGVIKRQDTFELYIGGRGKGTNAQTGKLFKAGLSPEELYETVEKVLDFYVANGKKREEFFKFVNRYGIENIKESVHSLNDKTM